MGLCCECWVVFESCFVKGPSMPDELGLDAGKVGRSGVWLWRVRCCVSLERQHSALMEGGLWNG